MSDHSSEAELDDAALALDAVILRNTMTVNVAAMVEGDICLAANDSIRFVRGSEGAPVDAAVLATDMPHFPAGMSDRFYYLYENHLDTDDIVYPMDIKSFSYKIAYRNAADGRGIMATQALGNIVVSAAQFAASQAIIIGSIAQPEWVAFLPMSYFNVGARDAGSKRAKDRGNKELSFGQIPPSMQAANPLPPILAPFTMPRPMLVQQIDNFFDFAQNPDIKLANPFTGQEYSRQERPIPNSLKTIVKLGDYEHEVRHAIWKAFKTAGAQSRMTISNPLYSPCTSDLKVAHQDGTQVLIEIKLAHVQLDTTVPDRPVFKHLGRSRSRGNGIFTYQAPWDYLLTLVNRERGYLICKDDIPQSFWHKNTAEGAYLTHRVSEAWLARHLVVLGDPVNLVNTMRRILRGFHSPAHAIQLRSASLTSQQMVERCGRCPPELLRLSKNVEGEPDLQAMADDVPQRIAGGNGDRNQQEQGPQLLKFTDTEIKARKKVQTGQNLETDAQLFIPVMQQCRASGQGCIVDLGRSNPFGRLGLVKHNWSELEKANYDELGVPPIWLGMLESHVPMLVMNVMHVRWRVNSCPDEPTPGSVEQYLQSHPCIMVCTPFPTELSTKVDTRWLIPSEFLPKFHLGNEVGTKNHRHRLYMDDGKDIDNFLVNEYTIKQDLYDFLGGNDEVQVGIGSVPVSPRPYIKMVGECKVSGDVNFGQAFYGVTRPRRARAADNAALLNLEEEEDEHEV